MPKIFFEDTGIANILENKSFSAKVTGKMFENSVFSEIRKKVGIEYLNFWRTSKAQEVDFIINKNPLIPIEVKLSFRQKKISSLRYFKQKYNLDKLYVCTLNKQDESPFDWLEVIYPWELGQKVFV